MKKKSKLPIAAINSSCSIHYTEHLAPLAFFLDIPLILVQEDKSDRIEEYYPGVNFQYLPYEIFTLDYLIEHFNGIIASDLWNKEDFHEKCGHLEKKWNKQFYCIHCPHGFSDKGFYLHKVVYEELNILYGQNFLDLLKEWKVDSLLGPHTFLGNYRYTYYKKNKFFLDDLVEKKIFSQFEKKQKTFLYAPTWVHERDLSSFFSYGQKVLDQLPDSINLIVKLHPRLESDDIVLFHQIIGKYESKKNIIFLSDFPLIYPLLAYVDAFLGDFSSVGYDFLTFDKPLFFLPENKNALLESTVKLASAGHSLTEKEMENVFSILNEKIENDTFSAKRKELYAYTFIKEISPEEIKRRVELLITQEV